MTPAQFKENRKALGMSQRELAHNLGCGERNLRRWERGEQDISKPAMRLLKLFILDPDNVDRCQK